MSHDPYRAAKKKVKAKKGFFGHLSAYLAVNTMMFIVTFMSGEGYQWAMPALMWGIGLTIHYFTVFGLPGIGAYSSKEWEQNEIRKELRRQGYDVDDIDDDALDLREIRKVRTDTSEDDFV